MTSFLETAERLQLSSIFLKIGCVRMDVEKILLGDEEEYSAIARLIELGRQKSYVTLDDILHFFSRSGTRRRTAGRSLLGALKRGYPFYGRYRSARAFGRRADRG